MRSLLAAFVLVWAMPFAMAQDVVVSELLYDPTGIDTGKERIEIYNRSCVPLDLTNGSICVSLPPLLRYYWKLPDGFVIPSQVTVTIHWREDGVDGPRDLFTGSANSNFLFGLGSDNLHNDEGAVAIYRSNAPPVAADFFDPMKIVDFLQYGNGGQVREPVAVAAGIWTAGDFVPDVPSGHSIAYDYFGDTSADYYDAATPSVGSHNGPRVAVNGTPAPGNLVSFTVSKAPPRDWGARGLVLLSVSGKGFAFAPRILAGDHVCLVPDTITSLGLAFANLFTTGVLTSGQASTPSFPFPTVGPGIVVFFASIDLDFVAGLPGSVSRTGSFTTE